MQIISDGDVNYLNAFLLIPQPKGDCTLFWQELDVLLEDYLVYVLWPIFREISRPFST